MQTPSDGFTRVRQASASGDSHARRATLTCPPYDGRADVRCAHCSADNRPHTACAHVIDIAATMTDRALSMLEALDGGAHDAALIDAAHAEVLRVRRLLFDALVRQPIDARVAQRQHSTTEGTNHDG